MTQPVEPKALSKSPLDLESSLFDPLDDIDVELPWDGLDPD